jgi:hypothetical protein
LTFIPGASPIALFRTLGETVSAAECACHADPSQNLPTRLILRWCRKSAHDPEKCEAVFRKDHAQSKMLKRDGLPIAL